MQNQKGISSLIGIVIVVATAVVLVGGVFGYQYITQPKENNQQQNSTACTEEAKVCPDGSAVGRSGPNCEFAECLVQTFSTKEECEENGFKWDYVMCDYVPAGKTFEEVCGKDFKKGWHCRQTTDQTAGWKTYTNTQYGFEFQYPTSLNIKEYSDFINDSFYVSLQAKENENFSRTFFTFNALEDNFNEFVSKLEKKSGWYEGVNFCEGVSSVIEKIEDIKIAGLNSKKITLNTCMNDVGGVSQPKDKNIVYIFVEKNNKSYVVIISPLIYNGDYYKISNTLLSTFKFITADPATGWKTYTNTQYGFEIKYPNGWRILHETPYIDITTQNIAIDKSPFIQIRRENTLDGLSLLEANNEQLRRMLVTSERIISAPKKIYIDKEEAYHSIIKAYGSGGKSGESSLIVVSHENRFYVMTYNEDYVDFNKWEYYNIYQQILSTFKFTK